MTREGVGMGEGLTPQKISGQAPGSNPQTKQQAIEKAAKLLEEALALLAPWR